MSAQQFAARLGQDETVRGDPTRDLMLPQLEPWMHGPKNLPAAI